MFRPTSIRTVRRRAVRFVILLCTLLLALRPARGAEGEAAQGGTRRIHLLPSGDRPLPLPGDAGFASLAVQFPDLGLTLPVASSPSAGTAAIALSPLEGDFLHLQCEPPTDGAALRLWLNGRLRDGLDWSPAVRSLPAGTLEVPFCRETGGILLATGPGIVLPGARTLREATLECHFLPDDDAIPPFDRRRFWMRLSSVAPERLAERIDEALEALRPFGLALSLVRRADRQRISLAGPPVAWMPGAPEDPRALAGCYLSTYISARKTGHGETPAAHADHLARIWEGGVLSSARLRLFSFAGAPVSDRWWHPVMENDSRVFVSYGSGIIYADLRAAQFILSPLALFLADAEFFDRDPFNRRATLLGRDPLTEATFSVRWENTPEEVVRLRDDARLHPFAGLFPNDSRRRGGRAHPRSIPDFSTLEGRLTIRAALDDRFALDGYVPLRRPITHRLEAYNNELRLRHFLPLDRFAEALVVPAAEYEAIRDAFIRRGFSALLAGVPLDDFLIPAVRLDALAPVIDADRLAIPLGGFEYLLRESRLPEYRIWKRARECGDTLTLLDLWLELNHGPGFRRLLAAPGLLTSRQLRERLRDPALPPESPERAALLAAYRSWAAAPDHRDEADPPPIAALFARCREAVVRRAMRMRSITGIDDIPETLVVGDPRVEGIRPDGATLLAEPSFLAAARIGAGRAGLAHLFTLELFAATSLRNDPARLYAATSATLEELGFRPAWEPLMEALDLSASRRERIRSLLAEAAHRSR